MPVGVIALPSLLYSLILNSLYVYIFCRKIEHLSLCKVLPSTFPSRFWLRNVYIFCGEMCIFSVAKYESLSLCKD